MSPTASAIAAALPPDMAPEDRQAVVAAAEQLPADAFLSMVRQFGAIRERLDNGDKAGARELAEPFRQMAETMGLAPLYDQMVSPILAD